MAAHPPAHTVIRAFMTMTLALACVGLSTDSARSAEKVTQDAVSTSPTRVMNTAHRAASDCGFAPATEWYPRLQASVARGERLDPRLTGTLSTPVTEEEGTTPSCVPVPTESDIFVYEDSSNFFQSGHSFEDVIVFLAEPANALIAAEGDEFDFVGFWLNFDAAQQFGRAFYGEIENDVFGIGRAPFNHRAAIGLTGNKVEGFVMMWNINSDGWAFGDGYAALDTQLVIAEEFQHRFGIFLPELLDGRQLQGDNGGCGRSGHWNYRVDGQGCSMEMGEWWGESPAIRGGDCVYVPLRENNCRNTDTGGPWSFTDLYLMGYVTPAEMDAGNSELRYLEEGCHSPYDGTISHFSSGDIIAAAGPRSPDSTSAQKHFRAGWIMIHRPGDPPSASELAKATGILREWTDTWQRGTLGRGLMNNTFREACNPRVAWQPVEADTPFTIEDETIVVPPGGARVTLDLQIADWSPAAFASYDVALDASTLVGGAAGSLEPVSVPDPSAGAFVDTGRADFILASVTYQTGVDTSSPDYQFSGSTDGTTVVDVGETGYAGTLVLDVSPDAAGTFDVGILPEPETVLTGDAAPVLPPLRLVPGRVSILPTNTTCEAALGLGCEGGFSFDNSVVSQAASPPYACGLADRHDGSLWFKFTATAPFERVHACGSTGRNATLAVYAGTCDALVPIACSEDACGPNGLLPDAAVEGLAIGEEYYVQLSAWQVSDRGAYRIEYSCAGEPAESPVADPRFEGAVLGAHNRYLSFASVADRLQSARVTVYSAPPPFDDLIGTSMWVGAPTAVSESAGQLLPDEAPLYPTFQVAELECEPVALNWSTMGIIHVTGELIIPGATYGVQLVNAGSEEVETAFSWPLHVLTARWGDAVGVFDVSTASWSLPDGLVDVAADVVAALDKFGNAPSSPSKALVDLEPAIPDRKVNITDAVAILDAFVGDLYPFEPPIVPCP